MHRRTDLSISPLNVQLLVSFLKLESLAFAVDTDDPQQTQSSRKSS
jgi:hypothetical protein